MDLTNKQIALFKSFFHGRQDVYAVRWEKDGKSGYMPAYFAFMLFWKIILHILLQPTSMMKIGRNLFESFIQPARTLKFLLT